MRIDLWLSVPPEDGMGNQIDADSYVDNWQNKFRDDYGDFSLVYVVDDGTGKDKVRNKWELEGEGYDIDDILSCMGEAHSYAFSEESSYLNQEEL